METTNKQLKALNNTINYFNSRNRNETGLGGKCYYNPLNINTEGCAIGRLIEDKQLCKRLDKLKYNAVRDIFDKLPIEVQELGKDFLTDLQNLHDMEINWDRKGLSGIGKEVVESIKNYYELN